MSDMGPMSRWNVSRSVLPWIFLSSIMAALLWRQSNELLLVRQELESRFYYSFPEKFRFQAPYFGLTYTGEAGNFIDNRILQFGAFEKSELFLLRKIVGSRKDLVFLDVGANTGGYTLFMSPLVGKVHAIEPFPPVLDRLRQNVELNQLKNVEIHSVGFGKDKGVLPFYAPPEVNHGVGSFSQEFVELWQWRQWVNSASAIEHLPLERGDVYLQQHGIERVDILKVDIEGYEKLALQGLSETLQRSRPHVVMELNTRNSEGFHSLEELKGVFPPQYALYEISIDALAQKTGGYELKPLSKLPGGQINILAVPSEQGI